MRLKSEPGIHMLGRKDQPHAQSFKGREETVMGKGAGKPTWVSLDQTHMFRQQFSGCP